MRERKVRFDDRNGGSARARESGNQFPPPSAKPPPENFGARDPPAARQKIYSTRGMTSELEGKQYKVPPASLGEILNKAGRYGSTMISLNFGSQYYLIGVFPSLKAKQRTFFAEASAKNDLCFAF